MKGRFGYFKIHTDYINNYSMASEIFTQLRLVPYKIEYDYITNNMVYYGESELFDVIELSQATPEYQIIIDTVHGIVASIEVQKIGG